MEWLIVSTPLLAREDENKIMEACVPNSSLDNIVEAVIPRSGTTEIPSTFESMEVELQTKEGVELGLIFT